MKLMTAIFAAAVLAGTMWAQSAAPAPKAKETPSAAQKKSAPQMTAAKPTPATSVSVAAKPSASAPAKAKAASAKPGVIAQVPAGKPAPKAVPAAQKETPVAKPVVAAKAKVAVKEVKARPAQSQARPQGAVSVENQKPAEPAKNERPRTISASGRRDPFISPVVNTSAVGSGCSTGKRCLAVGQISLKGVVKSETGMIAVVVNALDKAYFLRENDPVFDGYVMKITGDSIVFKETVQDKLGKPFTREVTKKITTPVV